MTGSDLRALSTTIISGYLGSGKTTLVNHILRNADGRKLMVLVNDFGDLPIDADLIETDDGEVLNLSNGCVCCTLGGDLFQTFTQVLDRVPRPDHLIIEASGVAKPRGIANIARAEPDLHLDGIVTLVDCTTLEECLQREQIAPTLVDQINTADILLTSKSDLVLPDKMASVTSLLRDLKPRTAILNCPNGAVPTEIALGVYAPSDKISDLHGDALHSDLYAHWSFERRVKFEISTLSSQLAGLPNSILRIKGIVHPEDDTGPVAIHKVGNRVSVVAAPGETTNISKIVAIGIRDQMNHTLLDQTVTYAVR